MQKTRNSLAQRIRNNWLELLLIAIFLGALVWIAQVGRGIWRVATAVPTATPTALPLIEGRPTPTPAPTLAPAAIAQGFDSDRSLDLVSTLTGLGPRPLGTAAHNAAADSILAELERAGWQVEELTIEIGGVSLRTIVGKAGSGPIVLVGTHYDTAPLADLDPEASNRDQPVLGANDGASGAAVLLELARVLDKEKLANAVWLAFVDGHYPPAGGDPVSAGAKSLVEALPSEALPVAAILLDTIGGKDQRFAIDENSDLALSQALWSTARELGLDPWFLSETSGAADNGVLALRQRGIPAANIVGQGYPFRRTLADTVDKIDPASLGRVGRLLQAYLENQTP
jgi:hypothetical protein